MRLRLTKVDEFQFLTCIKNGVWGSNSARFADWQIGDLLAIIVDKQIAGLSEVSGSPFNLKRLSGTMVYSPSECQSNLRTSLINNIDPSYLVILGMH
jgi:hypothetical protein